MHDDVLIWGGFSVAAAFCDAERCCCGCIASAGVGCINNSAAADTTHHNIAILMPLLLLLRTATLRPSGPALPLEAFNRYALVLDIDGNGWSDRYRLLAHANTPVLKQASNLTAFFEHLAAPGLMVQHYAHDLSDLPVRVRGLLQQQPGELRRMAGELALGLLQLWVLAVGCSTVNSCCCTTCCCVPVNDNHLQLHLKVLLCACC
jgi:hypothetical protein